MTDMLDANTLERWQREPISFIREVLRNPKTGRPFNLFPAQVQWFKYCWQRRDDGRLLYPEQVLSWIKKTGKSTTAALQLITTLLVFGGRHAESFCAANDLEQARDRVFAEIKKIIAASPLNREAVVTQNEIRFPQTGAFVRAIGADAASAAGAHPVFVSFDEAEGVTTERQRRFFDEMIPVPTQQISCRLVTGHAGYAGQSTLMEELYAKGMALPEIEPGLHAGDYTLFTWSGECLAPWQTPEWLEQMRATTRPIQFLRQFTNSFVTSEAEFVTGEMWDAITTLAAPA